MEVTSVVFLELGQDSIPVSQTNITGPFFDGDEIVYTSSLVGQDAATVPSDDIPKIIQFNIFATNAAGQSIVNFFAIAFTNDCSVVPVFEEGDSAGWLKFVSGDVEIVSRRFRCLTVTDFCSRRMDWLLPLEVSVPLLTFRQRLLLRPLNRLSPLQLLQNLPCQCPCQCPWILWIFLTLSYLVKDRRKAPKPQRRAQRAQRRVPRSEDSGYIKWRYRLSGSSLISQLRIVEARHRACSLVYFA